MLLVNIFPMSSDSKQKVVELGYVVGETSMYSALPLLSGIDLTAPYCGFSIYNVLDPSSKKGQHLALHV